MFGSGQIKILTLILEIKSLWKDLKQAFCMRKNGLTFRTDHQLSEMFNCSSRVGTSERKDLHTFATHNYVALDNLS